MPTELFRDALPYLKQFHEKLFVLKTGGTVITDDDFPTLLQDIAVLNYMGIRVVCVFGAGPQLDAAFTENKLESKSIDGLRVTSPDMIPIMQEVLAEQMAMIAKMFVKQDLPVRRIEKFLSARQMRMEGAPAGHCTGAIHKVDAAQILACFAEDCLPVCGPLISGLNCNADHVALALATYLGAEKLIFMTGAPGILVPDGKDGQKLLTSVTPKQLRKHIKSDYIGGGMIPKALASVQAVESGVPRVHIISGLHDGTLLREIFSPHGVGTMIANEIPSDEA